MPDHVYSAHNFLCLDDMFVSLFRMKLTQGYPYVKTNNNERL